MKNIAFVISALMLMTTAPALGAGAAVKHDQAPVLENVPFVSLSPSVTVTDGVVRLGDIFHGAGEYANRAVVYAPRPGSRAVYDARWLARVAAAYKLDWRPNSAIERVVIERASAIVTKGDVEELLQQRLIDEGGSPSSRALISNRSFRLHLPLDTDTGAGTPTLGVEQMTVEPSTGRFTAVVSWGNGADESTRVAGRVERMSQVPVLANRIMRGEVINEADIVWQSLPDARLPRTALTDSDMIIGMAAKRSLAAGKPITATDVRRPLLVNRGDTVTMLLTTPMMQLTAKGRALQRGSKGDTIRISNLQTNTVIDAVIIGPGQARVEGSINLAMR